MLQLKNTRIKIKQWLRSKAVLRGKEIIRDLNHNKTETAHSEQQWKKTKDKEKNKNKKKNIPPQKNPF